MQGKTHATIGLGVGLAVAYSIRAPIDMTFSLAVIGGLAALLPDIDHPRAPIRKQLGAAGNIAMAGIKHRGITHTLFALLIVGAAAFALLPSSLALAASGGYASHLLADMMTRMGVPVLSPLSGRYIGLPPRLKTGGVLEQMLFLLALGVVVGLGSQWLK